MPASRTATAAARPTRARGSQAYNIMQHLCISLHRSAHELHTLHLDPGPAVVPAPSEKGGQYRKFVSAHHILDRECSRPLVQNHLAQSVKSVARILILTGAVSGLWSSSDPAKDASTARQARHTSENKLFRLSESWCIEEVVPLVALQETRLGRHVDSNLRSSGPWACRGICRFRFRQTFALATQTQGGPSAEQVINHKRNTICSAADKGLPWVDFFESQRRNCRGRKQTNRNLGSGRCGLRVSDVVLWVCVFGHSTLGLLRVWVCFG